MEESIEQFFKNTIAQFIYPSITLTIKGNVLVLLCTGFMNNESIFPKEMFNLLKIDYEFTFVSFNREHVQSEYHLHLKETKRREIIRMSGLKMML